jgi:subtilisin family serine protease
VYTNYGATSVHIAAPGSVIIGAAPNGKICRMDGTSMAAPLVTAAIALKMGQNPGADHRAIINCLIQTAARTNAMTGRNRAGGVLDLEAFLKEPLTPH